MQVDITRVDSASQAIQVIDLKKTINVIYRAKWRIMAFTLLCGALATFVLLNMAPVYRATSTLLLEANQARAIKIEEVYGFNSSQQEYYLTQFEVLKSRSIAEQVFKQLNVASHFEYQPKPGWKQQLVALLPFLPQKAPVADPDYAAFLLHKRQLDAFVRNVQITPVRRTQLVRLSFSSEDPRLAQAVADALGEAYINSQLDARLGMTQKASSWLGGRVTELRDKLEQSEFKLEQFRATHNLVDVAGVTALDQRELERLNEQLSVARARKAETEGFLNLVQRFGRDDIRRLESLPEITSHISIQNVKREVLVTERKVSELAKVYGPKHPRMISAQAELQSVQQNLTQQILRLIDGVEKEAQATAERLTALEQRFALARSRFSGLGSLESDYRRLEREVEANRLLFDNFMARQKETEVTGGFDAPIARFTDLATLPTVPEKPNKRLILLLVLIAASGVAIVMALVLDALNDTIKHLPDVEKMLNQRALGFLPRSTKKATELVRARAYFDRSQRQHIEAVSNIRTSLSLLAIDKSLQIIEVTSSYPEEGKTSVSLNLAYAYAALERVLVIDADMRKPTLGSKLGLPSYQSGLANVLSGTEKLADCIVRDEQSGVDVLAAGAVPLNPLELLAGGAFEALLNTLRADYDKIIIDTPPVQLVSDSLLLAPMSDAVLLVVKADHTRSPALKNSIAKINQAHGNLYGVVLNQMDTEKAASYYGQYGQYGYYGAEQA
ncbi:chain-length determining protein [Arsukibacterium ikkense]|uniref:non-specific protein-tyrosine kinase n=1 Tax=Arsukibacterium ikkense TaxID=336831 RepID=A0A0M2V8R3_9GAMM|nr:polysaccharide biosynthesis tyrosine autokinase [Arsukibacterium ikkense]KKO46809.1 chain-length determining protein [Arsukibacterium ikkense]